MTQIMQALTQRGGQEIIAELLESQAALVESTLKDVLDKHSLKLNDPSVTFDMSLQTDPDIAVIYTLRKDGLVIDTFGWTLDLTADV